MENQDILTLETLSLKIEKHLRVKRAGSIRNNCSLVIGIPSVRRDNNMMYFMETIKSLLFEASEKDKGNILIILFIAEPTNHTYVSYITEKVTVAFSDEYNAGLIEIIHPEPELYPNLTNIKPSYGDTKTRLFWRSKETLDTCILSVYAIPRGKYFLFLEDDVVAKSNYVKAIEVFFEQHKLQEWWAAQMSVQSKAVLFKCEKLWMLIEYLLIFYQDKPVDWLMSGFFSSKTCEISPKDCSQRFRVPYNKGVFYHIGHISTLSEKN